MALSSAQCEMLVGPATSANPIVSCHHSVKHSSETAGNKPEEGGGDDAKSICLMTCRTSCYNGWRTTSRVGDGKLILKASLSSDCRPQPPT